MKWPTLGAAVLLASSAAHAQLAPPKAFATCANCHAVERNGELRPGPNLSGVGNRRAASAPGFAYSPAMRASGIVWNRQMLARIALDAQGTVPGTQMQSPPVADRATALAIADYLLSLAPQAGAQQPGADANDVLPQPSDVAAQTEFDSEQAKFRIVTVADGLRQPWALAFLPDGDMLVSEKPGGLRLIHAGALDPVPISGLPDDIWLAGRQAGLHGIAVHPRFASNHWLYFAYWTGDVTRSQQRLVRYRLDGHTLRDRKLLFEGEPRSGTQFHVGGRLRFLRDGTLLLSVGSPLKEADASPQRLDNTMGKLLRFTDDGAIPKDNPFVTRPGARPEIYDIGHRNVEGLTTRLDANGAEQVWTSEHGPMGGDEINLVRKGANYGFPAVSYGIDYDGSLFTAQRRKAGTQQPAWYWMPSIGPGNLAFYDGERFAEWRGDLFVAGMRSMNLQRLELDGDHVIRNEVLLADISERVRDVVNGPDGYLYLLLDSNPGRVLRLEPR